MWMSAPTLTSLDQAGGAANNIKVMSSKGNRFISQLLFYGLSEFACSEPLGTMNAFDPLTYIFRMGLQAGHPWLSLLAAHA